ncbi:ribosome biogenesis protein Ssf2 [Venturia nashicola]|nr:ribosome biogenesis protein Ssf2 [Venturia nashicola]
MARRRVKKRTHVGASNGANPAAKGKPMEKTPKSMVIRIGAGEIGPSVSQLVKDLRLVMEPGTASRLKERKSNKLRDYTTMCGPLGVTHLLLFSRSDSGNTNMRLAITPRGPTLHFRVENYSLCKDIMKAQRRPKNAKQLYMNAPLLVMNNFSTQPKPDDKNPPPVPKHLESLVTTMFQSLIPPLNPQATPLGSVKRVLLLNREPPTDPANNAYTVTLRHYTISSKVTGIPKPLKRLNQAEGGEKKERRGRSLPNLGKLEDVSQFLLDGDADMGNYTSASESEADTDAEVEVLSNTTRKVLNRSKHQKEMAKAAKDEKSGSRPSVEKRAVKLTELGPRMRLRLIKVEEGLCGGKIMWHDHVQKSAAEQKELEKKWEERRKEKEERRRIQKENVERKKKERGAGKDDEEGDEDDDGVDGVDGENGGDYDIDDDEYWDSDVSAEEDGVEDEDEEMEDGG